MAAIGFVGLVLGLLVGLRFKVLILVPGELAALVGAVLYGVVCHRPDTAALAFATGSLSLQFGYMIGALRLRRVNASVHRPVRLH